MIDEPHRPLSRRRLFGIAMPVTGAIALSACTGSPRKPADAGASSSEQVAVTAPEDLMREHGVLKRILLIYREGIHRLQVGDPAPTEELNASAQIIRAFVENYHEALEERYVFPMLEQAGKFTDTTSVLRTQHQRGRGVTDRILAATAAAGSAPGQPGRDALVRDMTAFIRMYEPHEAREDTVIFPALRDVMPAGEFRDLAEVFEDEEHRQFGQAGFQGVVDQVADVEKALGIYELGQFTAS
ncbi:hemerythrin domain-containing protein [Mycobacterium marinum]|uniref:hemerythrin domain-containing protein n=1 Tax=Mycobacterium marinum TaxID=1781 RepID=UPI003B43BE75